MKKRSQNQSDELYVENLINEELDIAPSETINKEAECETADNCSRTALVDSALKTIRKESKRLLRLGSGDTEEEHIKLLETVYPTGRALIENEPEIGKVLAKRVGRKATGNFFSLLIRAALPDVPKKMRRIWAGALTYALEAGVRPHKLEGFIWIKKGLVKCGQASPKERERELAAWNRKRNRKAHTERL